MIHLVKPILRRPEAMLLGLILLTTGCAGGGLSPRLFDSSDHQRYADSLEGVELHSSAMGRAWLDAGAGALARPAAMTLPWREELFFSPDVPSATSWQLDLRRGQKLRADLNRPPTATPRGDRFFLELFEVEESEEGTETDLVAERGDGGALVHDIDDDGTFLLRLQPELLVGGRVTLEVTGGGQLTFPVEGKDEAAIGSRFGDPRDGGRRSHRGVDIFAPRGTPAVAAVDGFVTRVGENRLGGRVVWMRGDGKSFYYAHLDEQLVGLGPVSAGEPLGRVGNTGNARTTPPHLHFGIFDGAAVDPAPYLASPGVPPAVTADRELLGEVARVTSRLARLRAGPSTRHEIRDELPRHTALRLESAAEGWYRAILEDGRSGYIAASLVQAADAPVRTVTAPGDAYLRHRPRPGAAEIHRVEAGEELPVLAELGDFLLVRAAGEVTGWLSLAAPVGTPR